MVRILSQSKEFTKGEQYLMTIAPSIVSMKDLEDGTPITVSGYLTFADEKENGDTVEIMTIITPDRNVYSCQSKTFKSSFTDIMNIVADPNKEFVITKISGTTKAGRPYIDCVLDIDSL